LSHSTNDMVRLKETPEEDADDDDHVVHEVTINILGLSGIVGSGPLDVTTTSSDSGNLSSSQHSLTSMKAAIAVLSSKSRAAQEHFAGAPPAPLSEYLQYVPTNKPMFSFQADHENGHLMRSMGKRPTVMDPKPHYTASWKRPGRDSTATATATATEQSSLATTSFDCTLRVSSSAKNGSSSNNNNKVTKPRRFELVIALVHHKCNNSRENIQTLTAVPVGVCELVVGQHGGDRSSSSSSCNKHIMELPVRRVTKKRSYPCLHIPNPDFKPLSALQKYKQDAKNRRIARLRVIAKKGLCFIRGDHRAITERRQDTNDDFLSRDYCTRAGSSAVSIAAQKEQQRQQQEHIQATVHLEKAVLRVEVEWKIKEFFEVYLEDPRLDRVPRVMTSRRSAKIKSSSPKVSRKKERDPFDEWEDDDPLRSVPVAASTLLTAAFSEVFACVASETYDFHERLMEAELDSRALEDIACGVPLPHMAASASPSSKREKGYKDDETALLIETLADCIVHEDTFPIQPLATEVSDNSTCNGGIHSASENDDSASIDLMLGEQEDEIIPKHQIHVAELEQGYHVAKDDDSFGTNQSSCLLNPVYISPIDDIPEMEETGEKMIKERQVTESPVPGIELESSVSVSHPPKAHEDLASLRVVPYLSVEGDSFLLGNEQEGETSSPAIHSDVRHGIVQPKPNQHQQTPMEWIQFDQSTDLQSLLTDNAEYIHTTKSILKAAFPVMTATKRKPRRGNPFPNLAVIEEKKKTETRQSQKILQRYYSTKNPLGLQINVPQNGVLDDGSSQEAEQHYFADFEDAVGDSFWNEQETRAMCARTGMQMTTTDYHAKVTRSFQLDADEKSI
jgi:hypothetical protein